MGVAGMEQSIPSELIAQVRPTGGLNVPEFAPSIATRWKKYKANKVRYRVIWIFVGLFVISLFAEFIANERPLVIKFDGHYFLPIFKSYPETVFGGDFEIEAYYRDPFVQKIIEEKGGFLMWPLIRYSHDTYNLDLPTPAPSKPTGLLTEKECAGVIARKGLKSCSDLEYNWLGTDDQGRDVVARLIYGLRLTLMIGLAVTLTWLAIGTASRAAFGNGWANAFAAAIATLPTAFANAIVLLTVLDYYGFGMGPTWPLLGEFLRQVKTNPWAYWLWISPILTVGALLAFLLLVGGALRAVFGSQEDHL
jgi:ABC-type microcin C transport system permease subunit YejE